MSDPPPTPPAGWYPGPGDELRWWDGAKWTSHVAPPPATQETSGTPTAVALAGLIVAFVGLIVPLAALVAIVFGVVAIVAHRDLQVGLGLIVIALICGAIGFTGGIIEGGL